LRKEKGDEMMNCFIRRFMAVGFVLVFVFTLLGVVTVGAKEFPSKKIRLIIPFSPGGGSDRVGRVLAGVAPEYFPVAVHVICMPGAGGAESMRFVAKAKPDGYTLIFSTFGPALSKPVVEDVGYTNKNFRSVVRVQAPRMGLFTHPKKWKTLEEFVKDAKANPGKYTYSTSGAGGAQHFPMEIAQRVLKIKLVHVPFDGGAPALMNLIGGHVDLNFGTFSNNGPALKAGKVRGLAHSGEEPGKGVKILKGIPSFKELGYDFAWTHWRTILAPAKTPDKLVYYLQDRFVQCFKHPSFVKMLKKFGEEPAPLGADKFDVFYKKQYKEIKELAEEIGLLKK
jgi:tripartite-type tricarboxylate transporter receptor subunit TctC